MGQWFCSRETTWNLVVKFIAVVVVVVVVAAATAATVLEVKETLVKVWENSKICGNTSRNSCSHSISRSPDLPLVVLFNN